uniref:CCHC-type domain-containing protein n=1 Tax=Moniliophthora roreri TaxID=221103 RepID=A0A0W0FMZ7_MONRR
MGVYAVIREKPDGARYWTYCTPPEYPFNDILQPVDALLHVLGLDEPFMTDELILMELHHHSEAKCLSSCPICSNHLCQGKYYGGGLYHLEETVITNSDQQLTPLPIIGNPVDLTIVYKDRIPEFYTELPEPEKPFLDSQALYCTTCRESHTLDVWAEESESRNLCHTALVHIPHYEDFPTKSFKVNMDQTGRKPGKLRKWPILNIDYDVIKKGRPIRYFYPDAAQRRQDTKPHTFSWQACVCSGRITKRRNALPPNVTPRSVTRMQCAEKCKRIKEQVENDQDYYASPSNYPPSPKKGKMGESSTSRAFCSWHNTTHSETNCSDVETEMVSKDKGKSKQFFSEISEQSLIDLDSTFLKESRDIVTQSMVDSTISPRSNEFLDNPGPSGSTLPSSETPENTAGLSLTEPTWPNTATTPWTDLKACGWHGMHRPESACSLVGIETWCQKPDWTLPLEEIAPLSSSPEPLQVLPPQGSSNITGATIYNLDPNYTIVPTYQSGEIPVELKHSDKQFVLQQVEDLNDAPHNTFFTVGNENRVSSFYNPLVAPTPPPEVARWEEENHYNYECPGITKDDKTPPRTERELEQDIAEAEAHQRGLLTQSILNPGGRAIPLLTQASRRELLTLLHSPLPTNQPLIETPEENPETRRTSTPSSIPIGLKTSEDEERFSPNTLRLLELDTLNISVKSLEELDPFQQLLQGLKNSPQSSKVQLETMAEDKKLSGSRPKREEPKVEEAVIGSAMPVQVVSAIKEVKAALPRAFTGARKDVKRFLQEVLIYVALNPKAFPDDRLKKLFLLSYMTDGPGEFWKNNKTDLLLVFDPEAEKVTWADFLEDFKTSFEPLDSALKAQLELKDLRMKDRADEYTYQFTYLAKQTGYNDAAQIVAFKRGLPRSLALKIMTRPEGAPTTIKDWMNAAILFDESYKQAQEYGKTWDEEHGGKKPQRNFRKKEEVAIKQISEVDRKDYMAKGLCFRCGRNGHRIKDCPDLPKKDEKKWEELKKLSKEERFAKIRVLVNEQPEEEKESLLDLMEQEGF